MNLSVTTLVHYLLALAALIALVVLNIWGNPDPTLTTALTTVLGATVWGGIQREGGIKSTTKDGPQDPNGDKL